MKTKLTFLLSLTFLFLFSGSVYGEDEVYYCAETAASGFNPDEKLKRYKPTRFFKYKFKLKLNRTDKTIEIKGHTFDSLNFYWKCKGYHSRIHPEFLVCRKDNEQFNFNTKNGRFVSFYGYGYVFGDENHIFGGDSIRVSYGKCDKF